MTVRQAIQELRAAQSAADRFRLLVADCHMPEVDGFTLVQQLEADPLTRGIPMAVSTSLAITAELRACLPAGIRMLSKNDLSRERVAELLREMAAERSAP